MGKPARPLHDPVVVEIDFDDTGFGATEYTPSTGDTIKFVNKTTSNQTVYILSEDGQTTNTLLLGTTAEVAVTAESSAEVVVQAKGTFPVSLDPPPQYVAFNTDPGGTTTIVVGS